MTKNKKSHHPKNRIKSFKYAFDGLFTLFSSEPNALIHLFAVITVVFVGIFFNISQEDWIIILLLFALVFITELFNSTIEYLSDIISPEYNPLIKKIKDMSAAAVLIAAIVSIIIGLIIFFPKVNSYINTL